MATTEIIQFRVTPQEKEELVRRSKARNTTLSETIRLDLRLGEPELTPLEMFDQALVRARRELVSSGLPELTQEEIVAYCEKARQERAVEAAGSHA